jgi:cell division protein FtsB
MQVAALEAVVEEREQLAAKLQLLEGRSEDVAAERQRARHYQMVCHSSV